MLHGSGAELSRRTIVPDRTRTKGMAAVQLTAPAVMSRIAGAGSPSGVADELFTCIVNDLKQVCEGVVAQGGVVVAPQSRCQRIEDTAVPITKVEELRGCVRGMTRS